MPFWDKKKKDLERQLENLKIENERRDIQERWEREQADRDRLALERAVNRDRDEYAERMRRMDEEHRNQWAAMEYQRNQEEQARRVLIESIELEQAKERERQADRKRRRAQTNPEALRGVRDLVRSRYQLDMEIWSLKGSRAPDRPVVIEKMEKADAVLMEIRAIVETWENGPVWTEEEWSLAQTIKERILKDNKRWWSNNPPWNDS